MAFSCGHSFTKDVLESKLVELILGVSQSNVSKSGKLIWANYSQSPVSHSCPTCTFGALQTEFGLRK